MTNYEKTDWFTDASLLTDPYPYFEFLRSIGPAVHLPEHKVVAVVGYPEGLPVFSNHEVFSAINSVTGPIPPLPFVPDGNDITAQLAEHREAMPMSGLIMTEDPPVHARSKSLLMGIITPPRLVENEKFMWRLADELIDEFIDTGRFEVARDYGRSYAALVVADLLGVPEQDFAQIRSLKSSLPGRIGAGPAAEANPLQQIGVRFYQYIDERRREPRADVMTRLAQVQYRDGTTPAVGDVVKVATFLFGAGQHTTVLLLSAALRILAEDQALQRRLRADRDLLPAFIEEVLRLQGPTKADYRLAVKRTRIGHVDIPAGTTVMLLVGAMNRDPRHFVDPNDIKLDRRSPKDHVAFGRGVHACAGAPLARAEAKISLERFLDRMVDIRIDESVHGPAGSRSFTYEPSFTIRGLNELGLVFSRG